MCFFHKQYGGDVEAKVVAKKSGYGAPAEYEDWARVKSAKEEEEEKEQEEADTDETVDNGEEEQTDKDSDHTKGNEALTEVHGLSIY